MSKLSFFGSRIPALLLVVCFFSFMSNEAFAERLLVVGNSLTKHGSALDKEWAGNWGMAASSAEYDFVHLLVAKLEAHTQNLIEVSIIPGYPIEKAFFDKEISQLPASVGEGYEYIVLEISDNIDFSHLKKEQFTKRYSDLIDVLNRRLKQNGVLVCVGKWWSNDWVDERIRSACEAGAGKFVSLKYISTQVGAKASEERTIVNSGVGAHPGDRAMREISEAIFCAFTNCLMAKTVDTNPIDIGVYYFPGWHSQSRYWNDLKGLPDSRSPNVPWPDREPLMGFYAEENIKIAEQHIEWASQYGVTFFAYDWYWDGKSIYLNHAVDNFIKAPNNSKLKFSLLWANHTGVPRNLIEFDAMVDYWVKNYFLLPQFYRIEDKPVVFVFSSKHLEEDGQRFGWSVSLLLKRADEKAKNAGFKGIFFVSNNDALPTNELESKIKDQGFSAYTGWCNVGVQEKFATSADFQVMVDAYLRSYEAVKKTNSTVYYIPSVSPGRDSRPWLGKNATVRTNATPEKFKEMLMSSKSLIDSGKKGVLPLVMIQSWNEFGEGAYIEPSKNFGFEYLNVTRDVLGK